MKESTIVNAIMRRMKDAGIYAVKLHGGPCQRAGLPDVLIIIDGHSVFLEVKRPKKDGGGNPTKRQLYEMQQLKAAGASVAVVRSVDEAVVATGLAARNPRSLHPSNNEGRGTA